MSVLSLLEMSLTGGVLILVVILVRLCAGDKLPKMLRTALWGVALCRLLLPFRISFPASIYTVAPGNRVGQSGRGLLLAQSPVAEAGQAFPWLAVFWAVGVLAATCYFLVFHLRGREKYRSSLPVNLPFVQAWMDHHRLRRPVQVRYSDQISSPLTYGVLWPVILLPKTLLARSGEAQGTQLEGELRYVLAHEMAHIRRFDALTKWLLAAALCVHWWNPLVWVMYLLANRDMELSCDAQVLKLYGAEEKARYAMTLVELESCRNQDFTPLESAFNQSAMKARIVSIMRFTRTTALSINFSVILLVGVVVFFLTSAPTATSDRNAVATDVPGEATVVEGTWEELPNDGVIQGEASTEANTSVLEESVIRDYGTVEKAIDSTESKAQQDAVKQALLLPDYETMSIAEFNRKINGLFHGDQGGELLLDYEQVDAGIGQTDSLAGYIKNTVRASLTEYQARMEEVYSQEPIDPTFYASTLQKAMPFSGGNWGEEEVNYVWLDYAFTYRILDQNALTVGERDTFLQQVMGLAQDLWETKMDHTKNFSSLLLKEGKALSNDKIQLTGCTVEAAGGTPDELETAEGFLNRAAEGSVQNEN